MNSAVQDLRKMMLQEIDKALSETRRAFSGLDPEDVVHTDQGAWRVRDVLGHLGVWMGEAARSLQAHAEGDEYHCITSEAEYDTYNASAAAERRAWDFALVWSEYGQSYRQLKIALEHMLPEKLEQQMRYPWNERGTVRNLVAVMVLHE